MRGERSPGEREREPRDVAEPHLGVEQPLVERRGAPARRERGRVVQLRVDEQCGLVEPEQLAVQQLLCPVMLFGFS
jgi:hypothetical protein